MAQTARRDLDIVLAGMILLVTYAVGQVFAQLLLANRYASLFPSRGTIIVFADLALVGGLILITVGMFRLIRRIEPRLQL